MNKAVFLDRDGVINKLVLNRKTGEYGAPLCAKDLKFYPWTDKVLREFKEMGYLLFLISNQPDYAKGYTSLKNIKEIHKGLRRYLDAKAIAFSGYFYCLHHPQGKVARYRQDCVCRKPKPYFALKVKEKYALDMKRSWFIGDCDSDIFCGEAAGMKTILINQRHSRHKRGESRPDFFAPDLRGALKIISNS